MGGVVVLAHRAQDQPRAGLAQHDPCCDDKAKRKIHHPVVAEEDLPQNRNIRQRPEIELRRRGRAHALIALTDQRREPQPKKGQRKAGRHLIGQENLRQQRKQHRQRGPRNSACHKAQNRAAGRGCHGKASDRAHDHHPLDPKVQNARLFGHQFARRGQKHRRRGGHQRGGQGDRVNPTDHHALVPPKRMR